MRSVDFGSAAIVCSVHLKGEPSSRDGRLKENVPRSVVDKFEVRVGDIDGCVHSVRTVVADRVRVIAPSRDFESSKNSGAKDST